MHDNGGAVSTDAPARLFRRARILTPDPTPAGHDSLAVVGDRIVAVGTEDQCRAALRRHPHAHVPESAGGPSAAPPSSADPSATDPVVVDLAGRTLVPGFIDAHLHPLVMSVFEQHLRLDRVTCLGDVLDAVADAARKGSAGADDVLVGFQLDDQLLAERRLPTADELEAVAPGRPVVLVRRDGHHAVGSATALAAVGLDRPGSDPAGGYVVRGSDGRPTGLVGETAVATLLDVMPEITIESLADGVDRWSQRLVGQGITAISAICQTTPEGPSGSAGELEAVGWSVLVERVPFDVQTILIAPQLESVAELRAVPSLHDPSAGRRIDAVKLFLDGTLGGASACMHHPFADRSDTSGMRTMGDDQVYPRMVAAHLAGLQVCIHAIGDRANHDAADLFDRLLREHPGPHRHRVEHASVLDRATVESFAHNGITCVVQPISLRSEAHWLAERLGAERLPRAYPYRELLDAGVPLAGSSDAPIEDTDVLAAIDAAVDRRGFADDQALTPVEALAMYTTGASAARQAEGRLGVLAEGARADLVVLSGDVQHHPGDAVVDATYIGGVARYQRPGS